MLNRMLRLHICKSNSRSVTVVKNVLPSTSCLKSQENGPSYDLAESMRASTRAYKIHIVVKNVLICTPYPQSHIYRLEGATGFPRPISSNYHHRERRPQFPVSVFRGESGATPKMKTTRTHSTSPEMDGATYRRLDRDLCFPPL